jgi:hypothetical protein
MIDVIESATGVSSLIDPEKVTAAALSEFANTMIELIQESRTELESST